VGQSTDSFPHEAGTALYRGVSQRTLRRVELKETIMAKKVLSGNKLDRVRPPRVQITYDVR